MKVCSGNPPARSGSAVGAGEHRLRTFQIDPKDLPIFSVASCARGKAATLKREGDTMNERAIEERQTRAWDIVWVVLYDVGSPAHARVGTVPA
jgi:hypothetical protein